MNRCNLIPKREYTRITCSQGDTGLRRWQFHIFNGSERWTIDADAVIMTCSNGEEIPCTISDNSVVVDCTEGLSEHAGQFKCQFIFTQDDLRLGSQIFDLWVEEL